ncbi:MAG: hypothetical protein H9847_02705 [Candidatus Anaerobiospirillum pullicola]|uniref:Uncharacterized protein n=1 Tax=Candidatus Anaerobiospirillum pullicola TaxID=2838451 RepID=A0A948TF77_9GAMM|nr:hypothetical protein [Candidatus Anaerobiospirillum pullicola]
MSTYASVSPEQAFRQGLDEALVRNSAVGSKAGSSQVTEVATRAKVATV